MDIGDYYMQEPLAGALADMEIVLVCSHSTNKDIQDWITYKGKKFGLAWRLMPVISALWEAEAVRSPEVTSWRQAWSNMVKPVSTKHTKISQTWWQMPVIPATQEAEGGESLKPRRQRLQ